MFTLFFVISTKNAFYGVYLKQKTDMVVFLFPHSFALNEKGCVVKWIYEYVTLCILNYVISGTY